MRSRSAHTKSAPTSVVLWGLLSFSSFHESRSWRSQGTIQRVDLSRFCVPDLTPPEESLFLPCGNSLQFCCCQFSSFNSLNSPCSVYGVLPILAARHHLSCCDTFHHSHLPHSHVRDPHGYFSDSTGLISHKFACKAVKGRIWKVCGLVRIDFTCSYLPWIDAPAHI